MDFWAIFYGIATFQGFFVSVVLLVHKKGNRAANRVLSVLVVLLSFYLLDILLGRLNFFYDYPHFLYATVPLWVLFPPLSYLYVRRQTQTNGKLGPLHLLHLIPFCILLFRYVPFYFLPAEVKLQYYTGALSPPGNQLTQIVYIMMSAVQLTAYSAFIFFRSLRFTHCTAIHAAHLTWLRVLFALLLVFGVIQVGLQANWLINREIILSFTLFPLAFFSLIIFSIAYLAVVQPETVFPLGGNGKYARDHEQDKQYADRLVAVMRTERPYLNPDLKYSELAARLGISARSLTEILRTVIGKSFNDFVNSYRVNEVRRRIRNHDTDHMTLLAIAMDAGFNSKSSFNRVFKKHTGLTPSDYVAKEETGSSKSS